MVRRTIKVAMNKQELIKQITDKVVESVPITKKTVISQTHSDKYTRLVKVETRDITLEDLLIAIEKRMQFNASWEPLRDFLNKLLLPFYNQGEYQNDRYWQLGKPLHEQSEECLEFIWEILK